MGNRFEQWIPGETRVSVIAGKKGAEKYVVFENGQYRFFDFTGSEGIFVGTIPPTPAETYRVAVRLDNLREKLNSDAVTGGNIINFHPGEIIEINPIAVQKERG